jgi:hypothetical protein
VTRELIRREEKIRRNHASYTKIKTKEEMIGGEKREEI